MQKVGRSGMMSFSIRSQTVTGTKEKRQSTQTLSGRSEEEIMDNDVNHLVDCIDDKTTKWKWG